MSIVTLKKKVQTQYNNMSVDSKYGFSINGTRRSQGFVGQTMLSRSLPRTIMKGNVPKGHGGCCGQFPLKPIIQSGVNYLNDPNIIKSSVINTKGLLETHKNCIKPINNTVSSKLNIVKPDVNNNINTQQQYIDNLGKKVISSIVVNIDKQIKTKCLYDLKFSKKTNYNYNPVNIITDPTKTKTMSQNEYITEKLRINCINNNLIYIPKNTQKTPFACGNQ